jgi:hypothetical protein
MKAELEQQLRERFPTLLAPLCQREGHYISCENGWFVILWMFLQAVESLEIDVGFWYIKEKWGQLIIGVSPDQMPFEDNPLPQDVWDAIDILRRQSLETCELCGNPGVLRWKWSWIRTLCDPCDFSYHHISEERTKPFPEDVKVYLLPRGRV